MNFAESIKVRAQKEQQKKMQKVNVEAWKKEQRNLIVCMFTGKVIEHFEWRASCGDLAPYRDNCRGLDIRNVPNGLELTKEIMEDVFKEYGIKVEDVVILEDFLIYATFMIE